MNAFKNIIIIILSGLLVWQYVPTGQPAYAQPTAVKPCYRMLAQAIEAQHKQCVRSSYQVRWLQQHLDRILCLLEIQYNIEPMPLDIRSKTYYGYNNKAYTFKGTYYLKGVVPLTGDHHYQPLMTPYVEPTPHIQLTNIQPWLLTQENEIEKIATLINFNTEVTCGTKTANIHEIMNNFSTRLERLEREISNYNESSLFVARQLRSMLVKMYESQILPP